MKNLLFTLIFGLGLVQIVSGQDLICNGSPTGSKITFLEQTGKIIKLKVDWDEGAGFNGRINLDIENGVCTDCPQLGGLDGRLPRSATYEIEQTDLSEPVIIQWASPSPKRYCGNGSMTIGGPPTITSPTGKIWMDRNLGASQAAATETEITLSDPASFGDLYQWGRAADGHQLRTSSTTTTLSSNDQPGHGYFIISNSTTKDWRSPQNDDLWQGVDGKNNPCPTGFRLPTAQEWDAERNIPGKLGYNLSLPSTGYRSGDGIISSPRNFGYYWSSTVAGSNTTALIICNSISEGDDSARCRQALIPYNERRIGMAVRCIKD